MAKNHNQPPAPKAEDNTTDDAGDEGAEGEGSTSDNSRNEVDKLRRDLDSQQQANNRLQARLNQIEKEKTQERDRLSREGKPEDQIKSLRETVADLEGKYNTAISELDTSRKETARNRKRSEIQKIAVKEIRPDAFDVWFNEHEKHFELDENGQLKLSGRYGKPEEFVAETLKNQPFFALDKSSQGTGRKQQGTARAGENGLPTNWSGMSQSERAKWFKENRDKRELVGGVLQSAVAGISRGHSSEET